MVKFLLLYLLLINAAGFLVMHIDKQKARKKQWRIPEATLIAFALLGGSAGAYAGMRVFHHKTRKPKFSIGIPAILLGQLALAGYLLLRR